MAKIDDSVKKKVPELRFPGFTDDWEERKLSNVVSLLGGNAFKSKDSVTEEGVRWLKIANVSNSGIKWNEESFLPSDYWERYPNYRIVAGDYVMALTRPIIAHELKIAKMPLGSNALLNQRVAKLIWNMNADFGFQLLRKRNVVDYIEQTISGTDPPNLSGNTFEKIMVSVPKTVEQEKIGRFLETVDNLLAVNQRKLDLLKEQKKGYLQKMFPKNGAKVPELRFAGFADDWEERKSKDIFKPKIRKGEPDLPVLSVTQTSGVVYRDEVGIDIKYDISTLKNYKVIEPNDFVISLRSFQGGFELSDKLGITSPAYTIFVPKSPEEQNNLFWRIQFKRFQFIQSLKTVTFGIRDGKSISFNEFGDLKIKFPSNILEQQKIGAFFKELDNTIALHQRKLDLLKEQKKGFLQKMFV
ncbi:restriction endonuclease subunit S [Lactococcus cremoris]|uniref:restriction endonuclease subunit S n=1 Tax=Lactococcus lactis subsp. cremoris TaxID=1359 RepID=UPI002FC68A37